ncbi:Uncharacterized alpha/beta hydrolase domain (DUF2235) domain containing protein [Amanita muscaria]
MSQSQHARDATLVDIDCDPVYIASPTSPLQPLGTKQAGEIKLKVERQSTLSPSSLPPYIPYDQAEAQPGRTLVLCFDGTGDQFDNDNSNIVQLVSMLKKDDKTKQMVYYQAGIGTYTSPAIATPLMSKLSKALDEMFAWNLDVHVMGGYEFLMQNYRSGDKICIFGFSRGSYIARSLAGMIHKIGIIPADNHQQIPFAYKMYTRNDHIGWAQSNAFKQAFSVDVNIEFVGVWDTVDSVGIIPKRLPFTTSNTIVNTFRHAVSLDEHRSKFKANLWNRPNDQEKNLGIDNRMANINKLQELQIIKQDRGDEPIPTVRKRTSNGGATLFRLSTQDDHTQDRLEMLYTDKNDTLTDVEEVWFAGCHCDIGGGSVENGTRQSLARIPLRWMVRECFKAKTGIIFDTASLYTIGLDPAALYPYVLERPPLSDSLIAQARERVIQTPESISWSQWFKSWFTGVATEQNSAAIVPFDSEDNEDLRDALSPKYDQLKISRLWWILEILPVSMRYQRGDNQWVSYIGTNMGKARFIPKQHSRGVKVHRSVKLRMEAQHNDGSKYQPQANLAVVPTWI